MAEDTPSGKTGGPCIMHTACSELAREGWYTFALKPLSHLSSSNPTRNREQITEFCNWKFPETCSHPWLTEIWNVLASYKERFKVTHLNEKKRTLETGSIIKEHE